MHVLTSLLTSSEHLVEHSPSKHIQNIEFIMDANTITSDEVGVIVGIALGVLLLLIIIGELLRRSARNTDLDELGARTMNVR